MTHHCKTHRPPARHRRQTLGFHVGRLSAVAALAAATIGLLYAVPTPADAGTSGPTGTTRTYAGSMTDSTDYGSGQLGNWQALSHATVGDILDTPYDGDPQADVLIVGDSITARSYAATIAAIQATGHTAAVNYWSGRPTAPAVDWVLSLSSKPKVIVMATGPNDVMNPKVMTAQIQRLKGGLPETTKLLWVDVQVCRPAYAVADQRNSMAVNQQIYEQMGDGAVIGWAELFWSAPWRLSYYLQDGVHPWVGANGTHGDGVAFRVAAMMPKITAALG
jgi:hypothetical protein